MMVQPARFATSPGGNAVIRATSKQYVNNASSCVFTFPTGSIAGDLCIVFTGHGYGNTTPTGWTELSNLQGSNFNGSTFYKFLTAGDITTGSVTVSFAGTYYGHVAGVTITGGGYPVRAYGSGRNGSGAASRTITTSQTWPLAGDLALYFGAARVNAACSTATGTSKQTDAQANSSMALSSELLAASGTVSEQFNFGGSPSGDYESIVVVRGTAVTPTGYARWRLNCTAVKTGGANPGFAELELRASLGGSDQTDQGIYSASSSYSGTYSPDKAFDNSASTYWLANSGVTAWIQFESFYPIGVAQIAVTAQSADLNQSVTGFNLQYWDGTTFQTAQTWTTPGTWTGGETRTFDI